ncbi:MAG: GAF domain-containing protein [Caldisericia bacterium]|nr:GAF domain-containing protein [Caldisericia bacterium]
MTLQNKYNTMLLRIKEIFAGSHIWRYNLSEVVYEMKSNFPKYDWVGIYLFKDDVLVLETYLGKPTEHTRIPLDKGLCGLAARERITQNLDDVSKDDRYIACDLHVRSEIVVPICAKEKLIGVLDIDSNTKSAFLEADKQFLEEVAAIIAKSHPKISISTL